MRSLFLLLALTTASVPTFAVADRGALSIEGGGVLSAARVPPGIGTGESVFGTLGGATLGARYAVSNNIEVGVSALWLKGAQFNNDATTVTSSGSGSFSGQLQSEVSRIGAGVNVQYVKGLVFRWHVGGELGWSRISFKNIDLINVATDPPTSFGGVGPRTRTLDGIVLTPVAGLEWMATDRLSFAIMPRIEFLLGEPQMTAFTIPIVASYSWYGLFR